MPAAIESLTVDHDRGRGEQTPLEMFIGGEWNAAESGALFDSIDPYTGRTWVRAAAAGEQDVDRAVKAARAAFEGPWSRTSGAERGRLLRVLAGLIERDAERLARIETR